MSVEDDDPEEEEPEAGDPVDESDEDAFGEVRKLVVVIPDKAPT